MSGFDRFPGESSDIAFGPICRRLGVAFRPTSAGTTRDGQLATRWFESARRPLQNDTMATTQDHTLLESIRTYNDRLDRSLRGRYGMTFYKFKLVKALTQLLGVAGVIYAINQNAPPLASIAIMLVIISGPEVLEVIIQGQEDP